MRRMDKRRAFVLAPIVIVTLVAAACGSSGGEGAAQATQPEPTQPMTTPASSTPAPAHEFVSEHYGFRVTLTKDWSGSDAVVDWNGEELGGLSSPAWARFTDAATGRTLVAARAPVPKGTELAEWRAAMVRAAPAVC